MDITEIISDEEVRRREFPVAREQIYLAHAGVSPLPRVAADAISAYAHRSTLGNQEQTENVRAMTAARSGAAQLLGCSEDEIALLGPTSLGLSLVANGLPWEEGDDIISYHDDYPANVYPWLHLENRGVHYVPLKPDVPGRLTWDLIEKALTPRTRLVALATCNFLSGYRIDVQTIGKNLQERDILFSLDAIQTLGAFPLTVEHVDFLSADSHKWLLGPCGAGIFYVKRSRHELLKPTLLGSWNVRSPDYVAQTQVEFEAGARRYEPGTFNFPGIIGMAASMEMLLGLGIENIAARILHLRRTFLDALRPLGYEHYIDAYDRSADATDDERSGIIALRHPSRDMNKLWQTLTKGGVAPSLRKNRDGEEFIRLSPHFYNTEKEIHRVLALMA